jgi:hypothetical protein
MTHFPIEMWMAVAMIIGIIAVMVWMITEV